MKSKQKVSHLVGGQKKTKLGLLSLSMILALASLSIQSPSWSFSNRWVAALVPALRPSQTLGNQYRNWGLINALADTHIHALDAWKLEKGNRGVVVAVIDTGLDSNHPDLNQNVWQAKQDLKGIDVKPSSITTHVAMRETDSVEIPQLENKKFKSVPQPVKPASVYGWDFVTNSPNPIDDHGHGTHVAGIIGAISNPKAGVSGVSPQVSIMSVKYYSEANSGSVNLINTIKALHFAIDNGAKIINYSGGGPEFSEEEYLAIKKAEANGILVVAAAGNEHQNTDIVENYYYPSAYNVTNIISVAAIDIKGKLLASSNWGKKKVDIAAPGENIYSTLPGKRYGNMSGTSQATAFVSGLAALMLAKDPTLTPSEIKQIIRDSADLEPVLENKVGSGGKVNAYKALLAVVNRKLPPSKVAASGGKVAFLDPEAVFESFTALPILFGK